MVGSIQFCYICFCEMRKKVFWLRHSRKMIYHRVGTFKENVMYDN